jgi:FKBP-type peptidyl-prolyl cis-trans isomerase
MMIPHSFSINSSPFRLLLFSLALVFLGACRDKDTFDAEAQKALDQSRIQEYLTANNLTATQTASGLNYIITDPGTGADLKAGDVVSVHYRGFFLDGTDFDNSFVKGSPFTLRLGNREAIPGFDEGLLQLKSGGKAILLIPSHQAYGREGQGSIQPNTNLAFEVELVTPTNSREIDNRIIQRFFTANNITTATPTDSGAFFVSTTAGTTGAFAKKNDEVAVHYRGKFLSGQVFEETAPASPKILTIGAGSLTKGFEDGLRKMRPGDKATLVVPAMLGYGPTGVATTLPGVSRYMAIPPYAVLLYEVELVAIR